VESIIFTKSLFYRYQYDDYQNELALIVTTDALVVIAKVP